MARRYDRTDFAGREIQGPRRDGIAPAKSVRCGFNFLSGTPSEVETLLKRFPDIICVVDMDAFLQT